MREYSPWSRKRSVRLLPAPFLLVLALLVPALPALAAPQLDGRRLSVDEADAQQFLDGRFPVTQDALGGLFAVTASQPRLAIPAGTRMRLAFDLALATAGGAPTPMGKVDLSSALRYDAAQQAFFLDQPRIDAFHAPDGSDGLDVGSRALLNAWLSDYAVTQPVYRIEPALGALLGDLQVESAGVEGGRLVVTFNRDLGTMAPAPPP